MTSLVHLSLTHFRNYRQLELDFPKRLTLLCGDNAQGKTNLLEAIFLLATSKPIHASIEREIVDWDAADEPIPYCRVGAMIVADSGRPVELELLFTPRSDGVNFTKQVKINGVNKRSMDLVGLLRSVLFLPEDIKLVDGAPSERRRYLDVALCQIDPAYCRSLSAFQKVVTQRNGLLKNLREQGLQATSPSVEAQLGFWDEKLIQHGTRVLLKRHAYLLLLDKLARNVHAELTENRESLCVEYMPSFNYTGMDEDLFRSWKAGDADRATEISLPESLDRQEVDTRFQERLNSRCARELNAGATLYGPHRDDLRLLANGRDLRTYGSRGQQRSAALSLKLAEVQAMTQTTGTAPLLLLDDVMSELDARRRSMLLRALSGVEQVIVTTTDWEDFAPDFRSVAQCLEVRQGRIQPISAVSA